jgi:DNA-binding SARP family transcriptional activator
MGVQVFLFGSFRIVADGRAIGENDWPRRKARQLLKYLFTAPRRRAHKEELLELLWPESEPMAAAVNLRTTVYAVRQTLDSLQRGLSGTLLLADRDNVSLRTNVDDWVDADEFRKLIASAQTAEQPLALLEQADELYTGDYLADDLYEDWAAEIREHLKQAWTEVQFKIARLAEERGDLERATLAMERLLRSDTCNEPAAERLMRLLLDLGRRPDALRVYQRISKALHEDLQVEPCEPLVRLNERAQSTDSAPRSDPSDSRFRCTYPFPNPTFLVGRESELEYLRRILKRGRVAGQAAFVSAPAGTGKSALLGTLVREAEEADVLCLAGGCYEERGMVPLGPVHDALADYLLAQSPENNRRAFGSSVLDLAAAVPELRYQLDLPEIELLDPVRERVRQFDAILSCLRALAKRQPVLLCLEDVHAADAATIHLIHYLARQARRIPLTVIATFRSEEALAAEPLSQVVTAVLQEHLAAQLRLDPLSPEGTMGLATALLGQEPAGALVEWLHRTAEGNPLFVEQLVFALNESGQVGQANSASPVGTASRDYAFPPVVREVIQQRFDRLRPSAQETLSMAAVLGQTFDYAVLLTALDPEDESSILRDLEQAIDAHLIRETTNGYAFAHTLLHQAMYWSISGPRRMRLHARAGEVLERVCAAADPHLSSQLAHHFVSGGRSATVRTKALKYGLEAGRAAAALSSYREALAEYSQLTVLIDSEFEVEGQTRLAVLEGRGRAERELAMWHACIATFRQVVALTDDPGRRATARGAIAYALHHTDATGAALVEVEAGLTDLLLATDTPEVALIRLQLQLEKALHLFLLGHFEQQLTLAREMLDRVATLNQPPPLIAAHTAAGIAFMGLGQFDAALEQFELARSAAERADDKVRIAITHENLGLLHYRSGRFSTSREHLLAAVQLYQEATAWELSESPGSRAVLTLQALGRVALAEGHVAEARAYAETASALAAQAGDRWAAECHYVLASVHALLNEWSEAESHYNEALLIREKVGHAAGMVESLIGLGLTYEHRQQLEPARVAYVRARDIAEGMDRGPQAIAALRHLGSLLLRGFNDPGGATYIRGAAAIASSMPQTLEFAPTLLALAHVASAEGRTGEGLAFARQALERGGTTEQQVEIRCALTELLTTEGQAELGESRAREAVALAEQLGSPRLQGVAYLALSHATAARGDESTAARYLETAREQLTAAHVPLEVVVAC